MAQAGMTRQGGWCWVEAWGGGVGGCAGKGREQETKEGVRQGRVEESSQASESILR